MKYPGPKPLGVLNYITKYKLLQIGYTRQDISGTEQMITEKIFNIEWLSNPLTWFRNIFRRDKLSYVPSYIQTEKTIITEGMSFEEAESMLMLHDEIKSYEEDEMKKSTRGKK